MFLTCLTCKTKKNLVRLDQLDINIFYYLFHPHSTPYLEQLKDNEVTQICTACRENIRGIENFRKSALKNFLELIQMWEIKTSAAHSRTEQQNVKVEIQSPSLNSTVFIKTEMSDLLTEEVIIKPDVEDGHDNEEPQSYSKMMLHNILQRMYVAKATPTTTTVTETTLPEPTSQLSELDNGAIAISQPATDKVQWTNASSAPKSVNNKKKANSLSYRKSYAEQRHTKFKCCEYSKIFQKIKIVQRFTMWELARRPPPSNHEFYPKVVQIVHKHFPNGWKNWVVNDYEQIFSKNIDPDLERQIRFLLPSIELVRAWKPKATSVSADTVRNIRRRLLRWPFGRTLIYAPKYVSTEIHDSSYMFVNEVLKKLKPLILSPEALSAALKEEVLGGKDGVLAGKDGVLEGKDDVLEGKDGVLEGKDGVLESKDDVLEGKDGVLESKDDVLEGKDGVLESKDGVFKGKDGVLEGKDDVLEGTFDVSGIPSTSGLKRVGESPEQVKRIRSSYCEEIRLSEGKQ